MSNLKEVLLVAVIPILVCVIQYSLDTPYVWNILWWLAYAAVWGVVKWYRFHYRYETGVSRDIYWIRFCIVILYSLGIVGLGFYDLHKKSDLSFISTIQLHIAFLAYFFLGDYISEHDVSANLPFGDDELMSSKTLNKVARFLFGLLILLFVLVILPGVRN